ncbi:MAG: hypothetical protein JWO45_1332 [Spartobacteria bacterium]|nr:hypothetical protein [Spartobacteria bacterium]
MSKQANHKTVVVVGASPKSERYAFRAMQMLRDFGHHVVPINPAFDQILGEKCYPSVADVPERIDTVTLYLRKTRSDLLIKEIVAAKPRRIIMNPGAENDALALTARELGIQVIEGCTLVMLRTGTF